jgi:hypothetical protein
MDTTVSPTNDPVFGVYFAGSKWLTNASSPNYINASLKGSLFVVFKLDTSPPATTQRIFYSSDVDWTEGFDIGGSDSGDGHSAYMAGDSTGFINLSWTPIVSTMVDTCMVVTNTNGRWQIITNNVIVSGNKNVSGGGGSYNIAWFGRHPHVAFQSEAYLKGWIADVIAYTNQLSTTDESNLHYYALSLYGTNVIGSTGIYP